MVDVIHQDVGIPDMKLGPGVLPRVKVTQNAEIICSISLSFKLSEGILHKKLYTYATNKSKYVHR